MNPPTLFARLLLTGFYGLLMSHAAAQDNPAIATGMTVSMEYTLKIDDGSTVASNAGKDPLIYIVGDGKILPALESALMGLVKGESKTVKLSVEEGYGEFDEQLIVETDLEQLPADSRTVGSVLVATRGGQQQRVIIREIKGSTAFIDYNHPLAGKALVFAITILDVK